LKVRDALTRRGDLDKVVAWKRFQAREQCGGVVTLCVQRTMLLLSLKQKRESKGSCITQQIKKYRHRSNAQWSGALLKQALKQ
jgi:hypothetical protein